MYSAFRKLCEQLLRIPPEPEPPPGDEAQTRVFLAAGNYYKYLLTLWALKTLMLLLILALVLIVPFIAAFSGRTHLGAEWKGLVLLAEGLGLVLSLGGALIGLALVRLDFEKRWYVVTDRSLRVREGIVQVREATITFANIQNISISQGPIQRVLGIADLRVDTAGGGGSTHAKHGIQNLHTVWFRGVDNATAIKELMQQRLRQSKDSGLGDHDDQIARPAPTIAGDFVPALREVRAEAVALRASLESAGH